MALTKTVSYTQGTQQDLGYSNEISGTSGVVTARIYFNSKMGTLNTGVYGASESFIWGDSATEEFGNIWEISGTQSTVNMALNDLSWFPREYADHEIDQITKITNINIDNIIVPIPTPILDREYDEYRGEIEIKASDNTNFTFSVGDDFTIDNAGELSTYTTTAALYPWLHGTLNTDYDINDEHLTEGVGDYKNIKSYETILIRSDEVSVGYIYDVGYINPHGDTTLDVRILDDDIEVDAGITTLEGEFLQKPPYFTVDPPAEITSNGQYTWTGPLSLGEVNQDDSDPVIVQLLMKRVSLDPDFDGDITTGKPSYVTDTSYGEFSVVEVGDVSSAQYDNNEVRWEFSGTIEQCNQALDVVKFFTPNGGTSSYSRDFYIETRVLVDKSREYFDRGYDGGTLFKMPSTTISGTSVTNNLTYSSGYEYLPLGLSITNIGYGLVEENKVTLTFSGISDLDYEVETHGGYEDFVSNPSSNVWVVSSHATGVSDIDGFKEAVSKLRIKFINLTLTIDFSFDAFLENDSSNQLGTINVTYV